ncbi:hypothetical protein L1987_24292 [Smallanthus sonchifolius]|uniref:Uncharacterized protein n=1 Tax=Smallanthus sonchifolius TaxID=185202 RepID=A0ACB9IJ95_9ASTR|nr:hypothetical protein L1987_24292 [Smallanthus sonchifolius]
MEWCLEHNIECIEAYTSDEEPNYEFEHEILSDGSVEPWDDTYASWVSATNDNTEPDLMNDRVALARVDMQPSTSQSQEEIEIEREKTIPKAHEEEKDEHDEMNNYCLRLEVCMTV